MKLTGLDLSTFSCGWFERGGDVYLYYGPSDTRCHVAPTTAERLVDYCRNTPRDPLRSAACVALRVALIEKNLKLMEG